MYALTAMLQFPMARKVTAELHYLDHDEISTVTFNSALVHNLMGNYTRRFDTMYEDAVFRPKPNNFNCSYCPFKTGFMGKTGIKGSGHCSLNP